MKVVLSYGLGTESTAVLVRWVLEPETRWFDWADLTVVVAQTGEEMPDTKRLVETHVFPLLRGLGVRFVQVARNGPAEADGWTVMDDSTQPTTLHTQGIWRLSDEMRRAGTLPQCQSRRCSIKFKGWVIDQFVAGLLGGVVRREKVGDKTLNVIDVPEPFHHVIGFNADETNRIERDTTCGGEMRTARYPLMEWGWGRAACLGYLAEQLGVVWRKSCCGFCPFSNGNDEMLARFREFPEVAADALLMEHVALALNPRTTLYRDRTLRSVIEADGNEQALRLFHARLDACEWGLYRVRRIITRKGGGHRSVRRVKAGSRMEVYKALLGVAVGAGVPVEPSGGVPRAYLSRRRTGVYPTCEEFYAAAPALAESKQKATFEAAWARRSALPMVA